MRLFVTRPATSAPADLRSLAVRTLPEPAAPILFRTPDGAAWPEPAATTPAPRVAIADRPRAVLTAAEAAAGLMICGPFVYASTGPHGALWRRVR